MENYNITDYLNINLGQVEVDIIKVIDPLEGWEKYKVQFLVPHKNFFRKYQYRWTTLCYKDSSGDWTTKYFNDIDEARNTIKKICTLKTEEVVQHFTQRIIK